MTPIESESLDTPITLVELEEAVRQIQNNKAPGMDGLPVDIYKIYSQILLPELLVVLNEAYVTQELPKSVLETIIIIILEPGKDPLKPDSYHPISLPTINIKILARVLANRLSRHIDSLIHVDQRGFIPSRSAATNIHRLFLNLQIPVDNGGAGAILSLDD